MSVSCVQVEPSNPLGERAKVLGPFDQERPYVLDEASGVRLEKYALNPPNANNSQVLIWRPRNGEHKVIVPPVQTTVDVNRYLAATRDQYSKLRHTLHATAYYAAAKSSPRWHVNVSFLLWRFRQHNDSVFCSLTSVFASFYFNYVPTLILLTPWRPLLSCKYSYKTSCATPGQDAMQQWTSKG